MRILWIEDQKTKNLHLFNEFNLNEDRLKRPKNFDEAYQWVTAKLEDFDLAVIDINLENFTMGERGNKLREAFGITESEFLEEAGFHLYLELIRHGFKDQQIVFLTGNTVEDSFAYLQRKLNKAKHDNDENEFQIVVSEILQELASQNKETTLFENISINSDLLLANEILQKLARTIHQEPTGHTRPDYPAFQQRFYEARLTIAESIQKMNSDHFQLWLNERLNPKWQDYYTDYGYGIDFNYLTLRRGIIDGCNLLLSKVKELSGKSQIDDFFLFFKTAKTDLKGWEDKQKFAIDYLEKLKQSLPLNPPDKKNVLWLFCKELAAEWEMYTADSKGLDDVTGHQGYFKRTCQAQMKLLRNWTAHSNLNKGKLHEKDIAFFFIIGMRAWFNLDLKGIWGYEQILSNLFEATEGLTDDKVKLLLVQSYQSVIAKLPQKDLPDLLKNNNKFYSLISTLTHKDIKEIGVKLLYQCFWHGLFPCKRKIEPHNQPLQIGELSIKIEFKSVMNFMFEYQAIPEEPVLNFVAKLIFNESF